MKLRTIIYITFESSIIPKDKWLSSYVKWLKGLVVEQPKLTPKDVLMRVLTDMSKANFSNEVIKLFKDAGAEPPYAFESVNVSRAAVHRGEPEQYIVSGIGNAANFVKWLQANNYQFTIFHT